MTDHRTSPPPDLTLVAHDVGGIGGMELQLRELVLGLRRLGHRVTVIARTCELPDDAEVEFHRVRGPRRPFLLGYPAFMLSASLVVRRRRRGLVQSTGAIVVNRADAVAVHYCHQVGAATPGRPTAARRAYSRLVGWVKRTGERLCFERNRGAAFICVSDGVADEVRRYYPRLAAGAVTIYNGVDTERFEPGRHRREAEALRSRLGIANDRKVAVLVGGEWERKGVRQALEAIARAPEWDLVVAGRGDEESYGRLAAELGVASAVHWLGIVAEVEILYEMADAFVLPTSYETFSLVTFEAAAAGLPIVATPVNGVRELLRDGGNGFLVDRDPTTIARRLRELGADPDLAAKLGAAARASALDFSWERMVESHHRLYLRLAEGTAGRFGGAGP